MEQRILAVDDEIHMLTLLERIVTEKTPYRIRTVNNPLEVPSILESETFDIIIADLKMPGMDGLDLLRSIKSKNREEEVIIITAFGSMESSIEALALGVFDYVTKPFKKEQIILTIDRAMRWQKLRRELKELVASFELEPWEAAEKALKKEYMRRLAEKVQDRDELAKRSGVDSDMIRTLMEDSSPGV